MLDNIATGVFDESIRQDRLRHYLSNPHNWMVLAIVDGLVVAQCMCVVHQHPDKETELYLDEIGTGDNWRRQGIATALMHAVFARADDMGIEEIWLGTEADNVPAQRLYEKTGATGELALIYYLEW
ncbi:GNAT family N-acetyltransferase [Pontixanthobacter aestiaquae]|uniref:GNAT family N-acetyltransferase n=1 Tax=Pontixanthobacter aestiaquae TaxID=1509367 RepID=UPI001928DD99|nr:GNAT family N-acetyltransferase [Pontixanthobacter aestiaquae]MDN3645191.1 GNAT family N-acetyltransferase [Pontixanthobacter aestiaquae]